MPRAKLGAGQHEVVCLSRSLAYFVQEAEAQCSARQSEIDTLKQRLAAMHDSQPQQGQESSSSDLPTATVPSPPMSPRSGVHFWLKDMQPDRARHAEASTQQARNAAAPGNELAGVSGQQIHSSRHAAAVLMAEHRRTNSEFDNQAQQLREAQQQVAMLRAQNEQLMELGNELRAQQHRQELQLRQQQQQNVQLNAGFQQAWQLAPAAATHLENLQQSSPNGIHMASTGVAPIHRQPERAQSPQHSGLQPFHPDYVPPRSADGTQSHSRSIQEAGVKAAAPELEAGAQRKGEDPGARPVGDRDSDEMAERLQRIEELTERIARAQLTSSSASKTSPAVRIPGRQQLQSIPPTNLVLALPSKGSASSPVSSPKPRVPLGDASVPTRMSARSTASQNANLQRLQQRQTKTRPRARNWNLPDSVTVA